MNDIETLRDYLIADEIQRFYSLPPEAVLKELISVNTGALELATPDELLKKRQTSNEY